MKYIKREEQKLPKEEQKCNRHGKYKQVKYINEIVKEECRKLTYLAQMQRKNIQHTSKTRNKGRNKFVGEWFLIYQLMKMSSENQTHKHKAKIRSISNPMALWVTFHFHSAKMQTAGVPTNLYVICLPTALDVALPYLTHLPNF